MKTLTVRDNDLCLETFSHGADEIIQCIELELESALNEFFLDEEIGRDMEVFKNKPTADEIAVEIARVIANESRVQLLNEVEMVVEEATRTAYAKFTIEEIETGDEFEFEMEVAGGGVD